MNHLRRLAIGTVIATLVSLSAVSLAILLVHAPWVIGVVAILIASYAVGQTICG